MTLYSTVHGLITDTQYEEVNASVRTTSDHQMTGPQNLLGFLYGSGPNSQFCPEEDYLFQIMTHTLFSRCNTDA